MKIRIELSHIELALIAGCIARSIEELQQVPDQYLLNFKTDLANLLKKVEGDFSPLE